MQSKIVYNLLNNTHETDLGQNENSQHRNKVISALKSQSLCYK